MKLLRSMSVSIAFLALAAAFIVEPALAQAGPGGTVATFPAQGLTYSAAVTALAPASSATDLVTISGVAGKSIWVRKAYCNGVSTAAASAVLKVVKRSTLDTSGTSTSPTKVPYNSGIPAAAALVKAYTANPTVGTVVGDVAVGELQTGPAASATGNPTTLFDFSNQNIILNSATELLAINGNGASFSSGAALNCTVEWSE